MRLWHTKTVWDKLTRKDPYWAVLTDPDKTDNRRQIAEFFETGRQTVDIDMAKISQTVPTMRTDRVLNFGCGVGRLTQGLAAHFDRVDGVDIAAPMIERAQTHNQHPDRVNYHLNPTSNLRLFPDDHFDLIYSVISLQHIPSPPDIGLPAGIRPDLPTRRTDILPTSPTSLVEKFRFSGYPPTLWKRVSRFFLRKTAFRPEMSMNSLKKDEILAIFDQFSTKPLTIDPYAATTPLMSYSYLLQKGSGRDM